MKILTAYKTEIFPTDEQKEIIIRTIGTCRYDFEGVLVIL